MLNKVNSGRITDSSNIDQSTLGVTQGLGALPRASVLHADNIQDICLWLRQSSCFSSAVCNEHNTGVPSTLETNGEYEEVKFLCAFSEILKNNIQTLMIKRVYVNAFNFLKLIKKFPNIQILHIIVCPMNEAVITAIKSIISLKELEIEKPYNERLNLKIRSYDNSWYVDEYTPFTDLGSRGEADALILEIQQKNTQI